MRTVSVRPSPILVTEKELIIPPIHEEGYDYAIIGFEPQMSIAQLREQLYDLLDVPTDVMYGENMTPGAKSEIDDLWNSLLIGGQSLFDIDSLIIEPKQYYEFDQEVPPLLEYRKQRMMNMRNRYNKTIEQGMAQFKQSQVFRGGSLEMAKMTEEQLAEIEVNSPDPIVENGKKTNARTKVTGARKDAAKRASTPKGEGE